MWRAGPASHVCLALTFALLPWHAGWPSPPQPDGSRERVIQLLAELERAVPQGSDIHWIRRSLPESIPEGAEKGIAALVEAVRGSQGADPEQRQKVLDAVRHDLALKAAVCERSPGGMRVLVKLCVRTWNRATPAAEVKQWNVHYLSAPLALLPNQTGESFPSFSSPTTMSLPPGRYVVWAQDPANPQRRGRVKDVTLGSLDGSVPSGGVTADVIVAEQ